MLQCKLVCQILLELWISSHFQQSFDLEALSDLVLVWIMDGLQVILYSYFYPLWILSSLIHVYIIIWACY